MKGYVAITTVLIVSAVVLSIVITLTLVSISEGQMSLASHQSLQSLSEIESCVEESLLKLNSDGSIPATINILDVSCTTNLISQTDNTWEYEVSNSNQFPKKIRIIAERTDRVYITSWKESN